MPSGKTIALTYSQTGDTNAKTQTLFIIGKATSSTTIVGSGFWHRATTPVGLRAIYKVVLSSTGYIAYGFADGGSESSTVVSIKTSNNVSWSYVY